jgi:hypothetical protein
MSNEYLNGGRTMEAGKRVFLSITAVFFIGLLSGSGAYAYNEMQLQQLKTTKMCPYCNLGNAHLFQANLGGANLSGATWTDGSTCKEGSKGECKK